MYRMFAALGLALGLAACAGGSTPNADVNPNLSPSERRLQAARSGDRVAQYRLGTSLCCATGQGPEVARQNERATEWLCRAAHQGHGPAQFELGEIYAGNIGGGWLGLSFGGSVPPKPRLAAMWFDLAMMNGVSEAVALRQELNKTLTAAEQMQIEHMRAKWRDAPCRWQEVYGGG